MKNIYTVLVAIAAIIFSALTYAVDIPIYPTYGIYSPNKEYVQTANWSFAKPQKGYLVTISAAIRFDPAISDYITCELPGMVGVAGNEKYRFSVTFGEIKTITMVGLVQGTNLSLVCASESQKLKPISLSAALIGISVDQISKR